MLQPTTSSKVLCLKSLKQQRQNRKTMDASTISSIRDSSKDLNSSLKFSSLCEEWEQIKTSFNHSFTYSSTIPSQSFRTRKSTLYPNVKVIIPNRSRLHASNSTLPAALKAGSNLLSKQGKRANTRKELKRKVITIDLQSQVSHVSSVNKTECFDSKLKISVNLTMSNPVQRKMKNPQSILKKIKHSGSIFVNSCTAIDSSIITENATTRLLSKIKDSLAHKAATRKI